jgi:hypothetical protein
MRVSALSLLLIAAGCSKTGDATTGPAGADASAAASVAAPPASGAPSASASAQAHATAWSGTYKSVTGGLTIPPALKNVHWAGKETSEGLGEGALSLTIDSGTGRVDGTLDGPLGPAVVDGYASATAVTANILRKDPSDHGFTGTLVGTIRGDTLEGTASLAQANAGAVRSATFTLTRH